MLSLACEKVSGVLRGLLTTPTRSLGFRESVETIAPPLVKERSAARLFTCRPSILARTRLRAAAPCFLSFTATHAIPYQTLEIRWVNLNQIYDMKTFACCDCGATVIKKGSNHKRCIICSEIRFRKKRLMVEKVRYRRIKAGGPSSIMRKEITCTCGVKFIRINPMCKLCDKCAKVKHRQLRIETEKRRLERRKQATKIRQQNLLPKACGCGEGYKPLHGRKYCQSCSKIAGILVKLISKARKRRGINVKVDDLMTIYWRQNGKCALTGILLMTSGLNCVSLDRINRKLDYEVDNIQLTCIWVNLGKWIYDNKYFISILRNWRKMPITKLPPELNNILDKDKVG